MWNAKVKRGSIWTVKSINEYENFYEGMTYGNTLVLILSAFLDYHTQMRIFTYLKISNIKKDDTKYIDIKVNDKTKYLEIANLYTGDQKALDMYQAELSFNEVNDIVTQVKDYFGLHKKQVSMPKEVKKAESTESSRQRIFKFGIDIYVTENEHVSISKSKKLILSKEAKEDIIYNSQTPEDLLNLSNKYSIYPVKAIREIKNRLVYQHKQKEG